jgi:hypothetical protein
VKQKPRYCPRVKSLLLSDDLKEGFLAVARMRCKQWDCEYCSIKNGDLWRAHLLNVFCELMPEKRWVFCTLTIRNGKGMTPQYSLKRLKEAWGKIYDALRYKYKRGFSYVMVFEQHKSRVFHIHVLIDLGQEYDALAQAPLFEKDLAALVRAERSHPFCKALKEMAKKAKIGYIVHARRILEGETGKDNARLAVGYVTKYFTKQFAIKDFPKRGRRIGTSRDIGSPKTANKGKFHWWVRSYVDSAETRLKPHFLISENRILDASDFGDAGIYPDVKDEYD